MGVTMALSSTADVGPQNMGILSVCLDVACKSNISSQAPFAKWGLIPLISKNKS